MNNTGTRTTVSEWQYRLLAEIFRFIAKEIVSDDDKEKLAPGELGINYEDRCFYIRNPHTGELFSPNSFKNLEKFMAKYDSDLNLLSADKVSGIRFYSDISQLTQLGISLTPDTIIRQMTSPSILYSRVEHENYTALGFPSAAGIIYVVKLDEEFVMVEYYDVNTNTRFDGHYNRATHYFEGWANTGVASDYVEAGGSSIHIDTQDDLSDMTKLSLHLTEDLEPGATISYGDEGENYPIVDQNGQPLTKAIPANNNIMLIYDEPNQRWVLVDSSESAIDATLGVLSERTTAVDERLGRAVTEFNQKLTELSESFNRTIQSLITATDEKLAAQKRDYEAKISDLEARPGNIVTSVDTFGCTVDGTTRTSPIANFVYGVDKLVVNLHQTILREGLDYTIQSDGSVTLTNGVVANSGDVIQFIVLKQHRKETQDND